ELKEIADVGIAGILTADAIRIGEHRHDQRADFVGTGRQWNGIPVRLRHLAPVESRHFRSLREQRLRLRENISVEIVESANDLARQLEMRRLVLADRDKI